tara:strand:+ start:1654 stop:1842 length:189 start_codon:yes stop_codon:yes gene_type:complete
LGEEYMVSVTIERLRKDSRQLGWYADRYKKQGKTERLRKVLLKKAYLDDHIVEIEETLKEAA